MQADAAILALRGQHLQVSGRSASPPSFPLRLAGDLGLEQAAAKDRLVQGWSADLLTSDWLGWLGRGLGRGLGRRLGRRLGHRCGRRCGRRGVRRSWSWRPLGLIGLCATLALLEEHIERALAQHTWPKQHALVKSRMSDVCTKQNNMSAACLRKPW